MATRFRETKNVLASLHYFLEQQLIEDGLDSSYNVIFGFKNAYTTTLPVICVRNGISVHNPAEIGDTLTTRNHNVFIDIFAVDDIQMYDIKDWIVDNIRDGFDYFIHTIEDNGDINRIDYDKVIVLSITEEPINLNSDKSSLDEHDRFRYRINLLLTTGKVS